MKKQFLAIGTLFLVCTMAMCINQAQIPDKFKEAYTKIETTQKEIETIYLAYEEQVDKRVEYVEKQKISANVDNKYLLSLLESESLLIEELAQKSATYSSQINDLFNESKEIKNADVKSKATELIITLRNSQQNLSNGALSLKEATQSAGGAIYYYATGADLNDPLIKQDIQALNLNSKTQFDTAVVQLNAYYNGKLEARALYDELIKMK
ncbi:MAG: hypothetical protein APG12_00068 [Candidatus Methanofastidiosum methylothiophilum]|uniref:Uncharacterized protein n=1 Tax=Candidatus Methanofastidiosum methylothiophilum TaxID=1705564 RepID=A0A150IMT6_9EURY|nr:MAG: hypothetical protein APG10_00228 [Candidatus Methanofastidiosum methylthiophilus]KYC48758.1 MAG: hypothetical protein APG11_00069 [Candidatus Methanofastidiosum methylthiophilus]KYC51406.1 MAG: hypothetical protein APG12_00068 [Candidatus Methanofastidiosum methylthiophilus]